MTQFVDELGCPSKRNCHCCQSKEREAQDVRAKLDEAEARLARLSKADMVADPIGYAMAHGLSEQEMALVGQAYLYHLVPVKAPPDLRYKLLEARTARERKADEAKRTQEAQVAQEREMAGRIQQYTAVLNAAVQTWEGPEHPYPESRAWFGQGHEEYAESLVHTANNIASEAQARGEVADLSPKAVAAALEADIASRAQRIRGTGSKPTQQSVKAQPASGVQPAVLSTKGQGASPMPAATSEEERVKRAMDVVFGSR